jgi:acyl-CoA synthetase (AMP-forming)/AMP-acid ligase II
MAGLVAALAGQGAGEPALADAREAVTWAQLDRRVNQWISVLRGHGLTQGDRVAFVIGNRLATYEALLACLHAGLIAVPVSWRLTAGEIGYVLHDSGARAVICEPSYATKVAKAVGELGVPLPLAGVTGDEPAHGIAALEPLLTSASAAEPAGQCSGSVMLYTSATTGRPKGVVTGLFAPGAKLSAVQATATGLGQRFGIPADGRILLIGPWYHAAQLFFSLFPLLRGSGLVLRHRFDAAQALADLASARITHCHLVPTQFIRFLALDEATRSEFRCDLRRVWHGGAACAADVKQAMIKWWGPVLTEYYAATEAGIVTMIDADEWLERPGSVGRPVAGTEVVILDPDDQPGQAGTTGRVFVRRTPGRDFSYYNAPEKTSRAYRAPGLFTVGDLGRLDADGYLYLTGRTLETIISGGVNIYPAEVEAALVSQAGVRDAAVFGIPDAEFGERVMAVVELDETAGLGADELPDLLDAHCRTCLADYKRPRRYQVVAELPREPTGKLDKRRLRDPYWNDRPESPG